MKKTVVILLLSITSNVFGQSYEENRPIWEQYKTLFCTKTKDTVCEGTTCKSNKTNISFELNFEKNEMLYLGKFDLVYKILDKDFKKNDSTNSGVVNTLTINGFTIQLFNFKNQNTFGKPEFISVQSQVGLLPKNEMEIKTITSYSKCYQK